MKSVKKIKIIQQHFDKLSELGETRKAHLKFIIANNEIFTVDYANQDQNGSHSISSKDELSKKIAEISQIKEIQKLIEI